MEQSISIRLTAIETRLAAIESRLSAIEAAGTVRTKRKRDLSPEDRAAIRARLVAGQKAKREREAAEATAKTTEEQPKANKQKGVKNGDKAESAQR